MDKVTVIPAKGFLVRKEDLTFLSEKGETIPLTKYVRRRITVGDMVVVTEKKSTKKDS